MKQITILLYAMIIATLATATLLGRIYGTSIVENEIYHATWFFLMWLLTSIATTYILIKSKIWKKPCTGLLHLSFLVILAGAATTFFTGTKGYMHITPEKEESHFIDAENGNKLSLPFTVHLDSFVIKYYNGTNVPADYVSYVKIDSVPHKISMNNILKKDGYRFYQSSYDKDGSSLLSVSHDPFGNAITYTGYIMLFVSSCLIEKRFSFALVGGFLLSGFTLLVAHLGEMNPQITPLMPVLVSPLLSIHVSLIMIAYAFFAFIMLGGIVALVAMRRRDKKLQESVEAITTLSRLMLYPAVLFLGAGIFIGAVWANVSWGRYWAWDPKEVWALITFMIYSAAFHTKSIAKFRDRRFFHIYMIAAFAAVIITYFGVNYLLGGIHSYANA